MKDVIFARAKEKGEEFVRKVKGKNPVFVCVIGNSETGKIPGLSAAGAVPEITDLTPPADVELLFYGECKVISEVPMTPDGIPTPGIITMSAQRLSDMPLFVMDGGVRVKPHVPYIDVGGKPGGNIVTGEAVEDVEEVIERASLTGKQLAKTTDYVVVGESIAGGTTTALGVMVAMGIDADGKVSSSMPQNPHQLKTETVRKGLDAKGAKAGDFEDDPFGAVSFVGDPMIPAFAGVVLGAAETKPVIMAGGTQMCGILSVISKIAPKVLENVVIGTTRWIVEDKTADIVGLVDQIADVPIIAANINFSNSKYEGLRVYETGIVKEGVGAGGITLAAMLKSEEITMEKVLEEIDKNYQELLNKRQAKRA